MTDRFEIVERPLDGLRLLVRKPITDSRGYFERLFCESELLSSYPNARIVQINHAFTEEQGTVRGLHFQHVPHAEIKFVTCLRGSVFDVAVDLRKGSATFLRWHAEILSEDNRKTSLIPPGFAHGYQTLTPSCEMLYFHSASYHPEAAGQVNALDPMIGIQWPQPITRRSEGDTECPMLRNDFAGLSS